MKVTSKNAFKHRLRKVVDAVKLHADGKLGLTNTMLNHIVRKSVKLTKPLSKNFLSFHGVFSSDCIPLPYFNNKKSFSVIINLQPDKATIVSGHFVVVAAFPKYSLYIDPFGLGCMSQPVRLLMENRGVPHFFSRTKIQDDSSLFCGMFCALFTIYFYRMPAWTLKFETGREKLARNERLTARYISRLLHE